MMLLYNQHVIDYYSSEVDNPQNVNRNYEEMYRLLIRELFYKYRIRLAEPDQDNLTNA